MKEFLHYYKTLKNRGLKTSAREIYSRISRDSPINSISNILKICEKYKIKTTFFIVGICAEKEPNLMEYILSQGHEIACHGYKHYRYDLLSHSEICFDLDKSLKTFEKLFKYTLNGFRAPYMKINNTVYQALSSLGFNYSSSTNYKTTKEYQYKNIYEIPVIIDDWDIMIKHKQPKEVLLEKMILKTSTEGCFLLHPWRIGQKQNIPFFKKYLELKSNHFFNTLSEFKKQKNAIYITGDIGDLSWVDIIKRIIH